MNIFKSTIILSALFLTGLSACNNQGKNNETTTGETNKVDDKKADATRNIDIAASSVIWFGKDPVKTHTGSIAINQGEMKFDESGKLIGGSITINMNEITVTDKTPDEKKPNLIKHLRSDDFFASDSFPTSKFEISNVNHNSGDNYTIKGNLTIRGRTLGVEVPAIVTTTNDNTNVKANFSIDRIKWGVNYNSKSIEAKVKDKAIDDLIELNVDLNAKK